MANLKPSEAAKLLNVHVKTLQRWDKDGTLIAHRTTTNRRYYTMEQVQEHKNKPPTDNPDLVVFYYEGGVPALDAHISGEKIDDGLVYSKKHRHFICTEKTFLEIVGVDFNQFKDTGSMWTYRTVEDFLYSRTEGEEVEINCGLGDEKFTITTSDWHDCIWEITPSIDDLKKDGDFVEAAEKAILSLALYMTRDIVTSSINAAIYRMEHGMEV